MIEIQKMFGAKEIAGNLERSLATLAEITARTDR